MARFKLVKGAGPHKSATGQVYTQGQVVDSDDDLVKLFPGKFERLSGAPVQDENAVEAPSETRTPFDSAKAPREGAPVTVGDETLDEDAPLGEESATSRRSSVKSTHAHSYRSKR
jgi:hypothetical protein